MDRDEIVSSFNTIEIREGYKRGIKSYALRGNVLDEKDEAILLKTHDRHYVDFKDGFTDPKSLFGNDKPVVIEIGFGMGTSTVKIAKERADQNYLCLDVFLSGAIHLLSECDANGLDNVKVMRFNAVDVLKRMVPDGSIDGFHIFFPDPWPKKRHHKRRLIQPEFVSLLSSKLKEGGYIYLVTDWEEYAEWMLEVLNGEKTLKNKFSGFAEPIPWRPMTKFEKKGLEQNFKISELWFEKA